LFYSIFLPLMESRFSKMREIKAVEYKLLAECIARWLAVGALNVYPGHDDGRLKFRN